MWAHFKHLRSKNFPMIWGTLQPNGFWPMRLFSKNLGIHWDSNSQNGSSLGSPKVYSLTLSHMKCDSWASFLARTFASPYLGHKLKARVATRVWGLNCKKGTKSFEGQIIARGLRILKVGMQLEDQKVERLNNSKKKYEL